MHSFEKTNYTLSKNIVLDNKAIPLTWWTVTPNFGDLLSPYLVEKMTSNPVKLVNLKTGHSRNFITSNFLKQDFSYLAIGSIISRANNESIVWGSGAFGTEDKRSLNKKAKYLAVRGPLTRNLLRINGINCPEIYGDPALLIPKFFSPNVPKTHKVGIILRWSENDWNNAEFDNDVKKIYLGTSDIEGTITDILSCEKILSSSLHGIILADAYGIPSAWLSSTTPKGLEFKFYDYYISVDKIQKPQQFNFTKKIISFKDIDEQVFFNDKIISFDMKKLLDSCPFIESK